MFAFVDARFTQKANFQESFGLTQCTLIPGDLPGPRRYLSIEEEEIVSFLIRSAQIGYPHTCHQVMGLVQEVVKGKGIEAMISDGWWEQFKKCHPSITLREAASLSYARVMVSDQECLEKYFDLLENTLKINGVFDDSS